jgi:hypothetical protein
MQNLFLLGYSSNEISLNYIPTKYQLNYGPCASTTGISSKTANIFCSLMTAEGPRRGTCSRLYNFSSNPPKTWWIWLNPDSNAISQSVICHVQNYYVSKISWGSNHKTHLPPTNRHKILNRLLISRPYRPNNCGNHV